MASIITNTSAMTALKVLRQTESALGVTQERISTGLKVNSAKDDASTWAISQGIKSDVAAFKTMGEGLTMATSAISTASKAAASINDQITMIKQKIAQAKAPGADKNAIQASIDASLASIASITSNASFNGTNLVDNNNTLKVLASTSRDASGAATANYIDVQGVNLNITNGGGLSSLDGLKVTRDAVITNGTTSMPQSNVGLSNAAATGSLTFNYQASDGQAKAVTLNVAAGATNASIADSFIDAFADQLKADGLDLHHNGFGGLAFITTKAGARYVSTTDNGTGAAPVQNNLVGMQFADATLTDGDEFRYSVNVGGSVQTAVLRVGSFNGVLGKDSDGNTVVGLDKASLTDAVQIATQISTALQLVTWDHDANTGTAEVALFDGAGIAGQSFFVMLDTSAGHADVALFSADETDYVTNVTLPDANFADLLDRVEEAATVARSPAQAFGTAESQAEAQKDFLKTLVDSLETGVGALIDADITAESARLNALQTQQQLATQSLSIANQGSQLVLSLFR